MNRSRGQSLVEFALVLPLFLLVIGAIVQVGLFMWAQNTASQAVSEIARWAAAESQVPCTAVMTNPLADRNLPAEADAIARGRGLLGYQAGQWTVGAVSYGLAAGEPALPAAPTPTSLEIGWFHPAGSDPTCPPRDNATAWSVAVSGSSRVPVFFPLLPIPSTVSATAVVHMEPMTQP